MNIMFYFNYKWIILPLPVNPPEIHVKIPGSNKTQEVVALGEINILRDKKLSEISFNSFFPAKAGAPWIVSKVALFSTETYKTLFETLRDEKKPCRLVITNIGINMEVSVEDFEWSMVAGDDDVYYSIRLKEYKPHKIKVVTAASGSGSSLTSIINTVNTAVKVLNTLKGISTGGSSSRPKTSYCVGDTVIANGKYWYDSYGASPFGTFKNFTGKISKITPDTTRKYRYHITTTDGKWRGWVDESQIKHP